MSPIKRRRFLQAITTASAAPAVIAQQRATPPVPKLETASPDAVGETVHRFFTEPQFAALRKLGEILQPAQGKTPGAIESGAPEFLDFLIGASPADRKKVYRSGLDLLNAAARRKYAKSFAELNAEQAGAVLKPLLVAWVYDAPSTDPLIQFICEAREDLRTATVNSREYAEAGAASGSRRRGGNTGLYFHPIL